MYLAGRVISQDQLVFKAIVDYTKSRDRSLNIHNFTSLQLLINHAITKEYTIYLIIIYSSLTVLMHYIYSYLLGDLEVAKQIYIVVYIIHFCYIATCIITTQI